MQYDVVGLIFQNICQFNILNVFKTILHALLFFNAAVVKVNLKPHCWYNVLLFVFYSHWISAQRQ